MEEGREFEFCGLEAFFLFYGAGFTGKLAGVDKKLSRSLEQEVVDSLAYSPLDLSTSPVGPLSNTARYVGFRTGHGLTQSLISIL
jgi:hypothetical protein